MPTLYLPDTFRYFFVTEDCLHLLLISPLKPLTPLRDEGSLLRGRRRLFP